MTEETRTSTELERIAALEKIVPVLRERNLSAHVVNEYVFPEPAGEIVKSDEDKKFCFYRDQRYSSGAVECQAGIKYVCKIDVAGAQWSKVLPEAKC